MPDDPTPQPKPRTRRQAAQAPAEDQGLVARLASRARNFRDRLRTAEEKLAQANQTLKAKDDRIAELQPLADGSKATALQAELTGLKHRGRFDALAGEMGVRAGALDDLYALSGYKAEGEPDDAKIRAAIEAQKSPRAYFFGEASDATAAAESTPVVLPAGPGSNRGGSTTVPPTRFTEDQLSDPVFTMKNWDKNVAQAKASLERGFPL